MKYLAPFLTVVVTETHMLEANALMEGRQHNGVWLLADVVAGVKVVENCGRSANRLLEVVVELSELPDRLVQLENGNNEGKEDAFGEDVALDVFASNQEQHGDGDRSENIHQWRT